MRNITEIAIAEIRVPDSAIRKVAELKAAGGSRMTRPKLPMNRAAPPPQLAYTIQKLLIVRDGLFVRAERSRFARLNFKQEQIRAAGA
jgi:hypothetical protein